MVILLCLLLTFFSAYGRMPTESGADSRSSSFVWAYRLLWNGVGRLFLFIIARPKHRVGEKGKGRSHDHTKSKIHIFTPFLSLELFIGFYFYSSSQEFRKALILPRTVSLSLQFVQTDAGRLVLAAQYLQVYLVYLPILTPPFFNHFQNLWKFDGCFFVGSANK